MQNELNMEHYPTFEEFWEAYDKKRGRFKAEQKWNTLTQKEKKEVMEHVPLYVKSEPNKQYRKDPCTFFNNRAWEDEIIEKTENFWST